MMVATSIDTDTTCRETIDITSLGVSTEDLEGGAQDAAPPADDSCKKRRISLPNNDRPRAIRWPPRSPLQVARNGWRYLKGMSGPAEIVFLGVSIYVIFYVTVNVIPQYQRPIPYQVTKNGDVVLDETFNRPYLEETFPGPIADAFTVYLPLIIFWSVGNFLGPAGDAHAAISMYLLAIGLKIMLVECVKNYVGYWRPYFFALCKFNPETLECEDPPAPQHFESFPSGHAATAMSSMMIFALYLVGKVVGSTTKQRRVWNPSFLVKLAILFAMTPLVLGIFIATSRIRDDWHHPADVLAGMELGVATALVAHVLYYPSVWGVHAGIPRTGLADERCED